MSITSSRIIDPLSFAIFVLLSTILIDQLLSDCQVNDLVAQSDYFVDFSWCETSTSLEARDSLNELLD